MVMGMTLGQWCLKMIILNRYSDIREKEKDLLDKYLLDRRLEKANLETKIIGDEEIAYIKIKSFMQEYIGGDGIVLKEFYNKIIKMPYLIIDIRGNGGGSDMYWKSNIVSYLSSKRLDYTNFTLFRGDIFEPYLKYYKDQLKEDSIQMVSF